VAVRGEDVGPPVEVVVEEERAEREREQRRLAEARRRCLVKEEARSLVVVERHHLVREVAHDQAGAPRPVVVGGVDPHRRARHAGLAERHARRHPDLAEGAVAVVVEELVRLRVVGHEEVGPAVAVVVQHRHAERLRRRLMDPGRLRHVLERAVAAVLVEGGALALVGLRRAVALRLAVERAVEVLRRRPLDVVGNEEIEAAVAVVVEEGGARREAAVADAGFRRDVREAPVAEVAEEAVAAERGEVHVDEAVVVVVGRGDAHAVRLDVEAGALRHVLERAVAFVAVERGQRGGPRPARETRRGHEQQVLPAVAVEVEEGGARAHRLRQVLLSGGSVHVPEADAGGRRRVGEHGRGDGRRRGEEQEERERFHRAAPCSWIGCRSLLSCGWSCRYGPVIVCDASSALNRS
jgi:hypothetical protein